MSNKISEYAILFGEAILLAAVQFTIVLVEISSKSSVKNHSKDQETLQNAADALTDYLQIGMLWTFGLSVLFYVKYDVEGLAMILITNILIMAWIYYSYVNCFNYAAKKYNLVDPIIRII